MKKFKVLNISESRTFDEQQVYVCTLAQIKSSGFVLPSGLDSYTFGTEGNRYIIPAMLDLAKWILQAAQNRQIVELNENDFLERIEKRNGKVERTMYHTRLSKPF